MRTTRTTNGARKNPHQPMALVLGAGGMVGAHVVRALLGRGYGVRALLRSGFARPNLADLAIEVVAGDLEDRASLDGAMYGVDSVIHCAGYYVKHSLGEMRQMAGRVREWQDDVARRVRGEGLDVLRLGQDQTQFDVALLEWVAERRLRRK